MTKPGNSGSEEPTQAADPQPAPETPTEAHESPTHAPGGPPNSTLPEGTDNSGASDGSPVDNSTAEDSAGDSEPAESQPAEPEPAAAEAPEDEDEPAAAVKPAAKARKAKAEVDPEPLMAELEKAPPAPREQALRASSKRRAAEPDEALRDQAKRRFEEPAPRTLRFSFYFFTCSGLVWLVSMIASLIFKQDIIDAQIKNNTNTKITPDQISGAVTQILWIVTVAALAFTVMLALFGYKATEGTRRARTLVTIFSTILILFHLLLNGTQLGIFSALLSLIGLALLWSPSARAYFPPRQIP